MSRISSCAACHGDILIPGSAQPADRMRCPLCNAQFLVQDVLAASIQAPPEAIIVEQPAGIISAAVGPRLSREPDIPDWNVEDNPKTVVHKRKGPGALGQLVRIFGGGVVGLALGYVGLLRFGGPQYDALKVLDKLPPKVAVWLKPPPKPAAGGAERAPQRELKDLQNAPDTPPPAPLPEGAPPFDFPPPGGAPQAAPATPPAAPAQSPTTQIAPPDAEPRAAVDPFGDASSGGAPPVAGSSAPPALEAITGPKQVLLYRAADLQAALADTGSLVGCPVCNSTGFVRRPVVTGVREVKGERVERTADRRVTCDACGGKPPTRITPDAYARLCRLAEVVTFVDAKTASENELAPLADQVQRLIVAAGADARTLETIGRLAGYQLDQAERKQNGVALAGTVQQISQEGKFYTMRIVLLGLPKVVTVVSRRPPQTAIKEHDRVLILGSIVNDPGENLNGYSGSLPQLVWGGMPVRLPAP